MLKFKRPHTRVSRILPNFNANYTGMEKHINLFNFPAGTAICVYAIWALVQPEVAAEEDKHNYSSNNHLR